MSPRAVLPPDGPVASGLAEVVLDSLPDATAVVDRHGTIIQVNHAWRMFSLDNGGDPASNSIGSNYLDVCVRADAAGCPEAGQVAADLRGVLAGAVVDAESEYPCPSPASDRWFLVRVTGLTGGRGGAVISHMNITRRRLAEQQLSHSASHDPLTGLANRTLGNSVLAAALTPRTDRAAGPDVGLVCIDLDGFKAVNDDFGHAAGDEVLMTVAGRLRAATGPGQTVVRPGGDEFLVIWPMTGAGELARLGRRIEQSLAEPHRIQGRQIVVPGSVGIHLAAAGDRGEDAIAGADAAMYVAKRARPHPERRGAR